MKISWKWLQDWIALGDVDVDDVARRLTMAGLEVDAVERLGTHTGEILVGRIDSIEPHPKADRLVVCRVDVGEETLRQIVCGAKNMAPGDFVPVAMPGSRPPALDFDIVSRKVMGVESHGMLCSESELGLAKEAEGLMLLPRDLRLGAPFFAAMDLDDVVFHIGLTPNRTDCLSHRGVALELGALLGRPLKSSSERTIEALASLQAPEAALHGVALHIADVQGCPGYGFAVLENVQVGEGPAWMKRRLQAVGVRAINNIVDVTNFVMFDLGQPLHAFDLERLAGSRIEVRRARTGEKFLGLDHREYELVAEDLVIADGEGPVALAGVMGGSRTEVTEATRRVLLECAFFDPRSVRRSARRHGLHTESSHRFERRIDPSALAGNLARAAQRLLEAHAHLPHAAPALLPALGLMQSVVPAGGHVLELADGFANRILGTALSREQVEGYLKALGLGVEPGEGKLLVHVPERRPDLERPIDLVEEIARLHGFDHIAPTLPLAPMATTHVRRKDSAEAPTIVPGAVRQELRRWRRLLAARGLYEAVNYSFMAEEDVLDDTQGPAPLANPLVRQHALMRTSLIPSLLNNLAYNFAQRTFDVALFEMGRRYLAHGEFPSLGFVVTGALPAHWSAKATWDFFDAKGLVEMLAEGRELGALRWHTSAHAWLHPGVQAEWRHEELGTLARVGQIHPEIAQKREWEAPVFVAEVFLDRLLALGRRTTRYSPMARFPAVTRDFAFLVDRDGHYGDIEQAITKLAAEAPALGAILESVDLFDLYQGPQVPAGKRSLAIALVYRAADRTLTEQEVEQADRLLVTCLQETLGAQLRG